MKKILRSYKFRLYPTKVQSVLLNKHFGSCRFIYNYFLNLRKEEYLLNKKTLNFFQCSYKLTELKKQEELKWLNDVYAQSLQWALKHLDVAFNRFFHKTSKFPTFKKKSSKQSYSVPQGFVVKNDKLFIGKFREGIKLNISKKIIGQIIQCTVSKTPTGKYFASLTCEQEYAQYEPTGSSVGVDVGIKDLAILSNGKKYKNVRSLKLKLKKLKFKQRQVSKKVKGSSSRKKAIKQLALVHEKIVNVRKDHLHKVTTDIIKNHDVICVETLAVINMMKNHKLAQALSDCAIGEFFSMLEYKASWNDKTIIKIDRWFPSSKMCSKCTWLNQNLTLKDRSWTCRECGTTHDRDVNAACNILTQGLKLKSGLGAKSDSKQKPVEPSKKYLLRGPKGQHGKKEAEKLDISAKK